MALLGFTVRDLQHEMTKLFMTDQKLSIPHCRTNVNDCSLLILFPTQVFSLFQFLLLKRVGSKSSEEFLLKVT